jgi:hypothetical protein
MPYTDLREKERINSRENELLFFFEEVLVIFFFFDSYYPVYGGPCIAFVMSKE